MSGRSHYEVLGVAPTATPAEVRKAYVDRARRLHPDRLHDVPAAESARMARAMQDVNEAWRVLRSPASRSAYDARLAGTGPRAPTASTPPRRAAPMGDVDLDPTPYYQRPEGMVDPTTSVLRSLPWLVALFVLGLIFVVTAFAGGADDGRESSYDLVGSCVQSQTGIGLVPVPCSGPNEGRVELVVGRQSQCPDDAIVRAVPGQGAWACLRPAG